MAIDSNTNGLAYSMRSVHLLDAQQLTENIWRDRSLNDAQAYLRRVLNLSSKGRAKAIVAEENPTQHIIGYSLLSRLTKCYEISDVIVAESYRRQGIGSAMIEHLIQQIDESASLPLEIGVATSNTHALALYQRLGFEPHYHLMLDIGHGQERILYLRYIYH